MQESTQRIEALLMLNHARRHVRSLRNFSQRWILPQFPWLHEILFFSLRKACINTIYSLRRQKLPVHILGLHRNKNSERQPLVSVIVPNYNHARYLQDRLHSIINQTYANIEIILLDDCSQDESISILQKFQQASHIPCQLIVNEKNTGSGFIQWHRGISLAKGELIWIAESDDFCNSDFLKELVPAFADESVIIAFGKTIFCDDRGMKKIWTAADYLPELSQSTWDKPWSIGCNKLVENMWGRRNIIPNASGCLIRASAARYTLLCTEWQQLTVCGDWLFYLYASRGGYINYSPSAINYYRQHTSNTSTDPQKILEIYREHLIVANWITDHFGLSKTACRILKKELKKRWAEQQNSHMPTAFKDAITSLQPHIAGKNKLANILLVTYSFVAGGGEVFPLRLANSLKEQGYQVTILSCDQHPEQLRIRKILNLCIPVIRLRHPRDINYIVEQLDIDIIHTHNAWADATISESLNRNTRAKHIITSHGMYDSLDPTELDRMRAVINSTVSFATYVAEKNKAAMLRLGLEESKLFRIANAVPISIYQPISRESLNIPENSFIITLASRAIREKGWSVAIKAIHLARQQSKKDIHLILVGDGPEAANLSNHEYGKRFIHFLGLQHDTRPFFAIADLGLLTSYFCGESQPLTLIECLQSGTPYLASDIGEIADMLKSPRGMAGQVVALKNGQIRPEPFANAIMGYLKDPKLLHDQKSCCADALLKFDWDAMVSAYLKVYQRALQ